MDIAAIVSRFTMQKVIEQRAGVLTGFGTQTRSIAWQSRLTFGVLILGVVYLLWFSLQLAAMRLYQVDECMEVYVAKVLASGVDKMAAGHVTLFQIPLSWLMRAGASSADLLATARLAMVMLLWVNWILMATATGARLFSLRWMAALAAVASLAPIWDYGFEVRHDNLMLTGLLMLWIAVRLQPMGLPTYVFAGIITVLLEFVAFKAFVYTIPISGAILAMPRLVKPHARWKLAIAWLAGALAAFAVIRISFGLAGLWELYMTGFHFLSTATGASPQPRFWPTVIFLRMCNQAPLLTALTVAALAAVILEVRRRGRAVLNWEGNLPEAFLFLVALGALLVNPAPYPYNFLHFVPYAFLFAFPYACRLWAEIRKQPMLVPIAASLVLFAHAGTFAIATHRHLRWANTRQEMVMNLAERVTDPQKDPVFDAIGMVSTRPIVDHRAFLHGLNFESIVKGSGPQVRDMLAARPPAVIIQSYRTDWLPDPDREFIASRYVSLSDDMMVLGKVLSAGGGTFEIVHPGRYRISPLANSDLLDSYPDGLGGIVTATNVPPIAGTLDGAAIKGRVVELSAGTHRIDCPAALQPAVVWVGPQLDRLPRIGRGDHETLFVDWY
jgi:hypothetical protein